MLTVALFCQACCYPLNFNKSEFKSDQQEAAEQYKSTEDDQSVVEFDADNRDIENIPYNHEAGSYYNAGRQRKEGPESGLVPMETNLMMDQIMDNGMGACVIM